MLWDLRGAGLCLELSRRPPRASGVGVGPWGVMRPIRQRTGERYVISAKPNTPPAPDSSASGVVRAARRCLMPLMGRGSEVKAGEGSQRKEGPEPSSCSGKGNGRDGLDLY